MQSEIDYALFIFEEKMGSCNVSEDYKSFLWFLVFDSVKQNHFSKPMPWIGMYIALGSLFCVLAMVADLIHGFRNKRLWFPCKYFTVNAASLTVIAVAMKLPVDLNNSMPGNVDQGTKVGSIAFMCTMMANLLPSLATMNSNELIANMIALGILVITLVVNVCIEINTGVVGNEIEFIIIAAFYVGMLLMLLITHTCSSLAILKSKQILESKYQEAHQKALKEYQEAENITVEKLKEHVSNYWIMAGTGNPQFMTASSATTTAAGVICALCTALHILTSIVAISSLYDADSDYKWSMIVILFIQLIGVLVGTIAPLCRCFAALSFKLSKERIWNHINVFKVESYWTQKLSDWKQSSIPSPFRSRTCKIVIENTKILILDILIGFQMTAVVVCKMIALIPIFFVICVCCWKWLKGRSSALGTASVNKHEKLEINEELSQYVLKLEDDVEFAERTLKAITKSVNPLIEKAEKQQPKNLINILKESKGFEGVGKYDSHHVPSLLHSEEYLDCWSLALVTLTTIAISLPKIQNDKADMLLRSVSEGLVYVKLVEESLNASDKYVTVKKAAKMLWLEVEIHHKWFGNKLPSPDFQMNSKSREILEWFRDKAKLDMGIDGSMGNGSRNDNSMCKSICANSMYRITETILHLYKDNIDQVGQEQLFEELSLMIADILAACLTNLPQVIAMKCHTNEIEKREASVYAAAQLLGETTQIITDLQDREIPSLNQDGMPFIGKWCDYLRHPLP